MRFSILAVTMTMMAAVSAHAAVVLDQQHNFASAVADSTNGNISELGQTFTVGVTGTLDHIDVLMFRLLDIFDPTGDPRLNLYNTAAGVPTGAALATSLVPEAQVPVNAAGFVTFDLSAAGISVVAGDVLAFGISTLSDPQPYFLPNDVDTGAVDDYGTGAAFRRFINPVTAWQPLAPSQDHGFRTFVNAVPEPSAFVLASIALFGVARLVPRRKRESVRHQRGLSCADGRRSH